MKIYFIRAGFATFIGTASQCEAFIDANGGFSAVNVHEEVTNPAFIRACM